MKNYVKKNAFFHDSLSKLLIYTFVLESFKKVA